MTTTKSTYAVLAVGAALTLVLAGCGSSAPSSPAAATTRAGGAQGSGSGSGDGRPPGVTGLIAAVQGTTLQVQSTTQQTAVSYTSKTRITDQVKTTASALAIGDCVMARPAASAQTGATPGTTPTTPVTPTTTVAAASVQIISTGSTGCAALRQGGGTGGNRSSGAPTGGPTGTDSGAGSGRQAGGRGLGGFGAVGTVDAIHNGTFTLTETSGRQGTATASSPRTVTVTYTASTTFEATKVVAASAIKVGGCVTAAGPADDTGGVAATSLALSAAVNGQCTSGFRRG